METGAYRRLLVASITSLGAIVLFVVAFSPSGSDVDLPAPIEQIFPLPGDTVVRQTAIEVDLPVGYSMVLDVDGIRIPAIEIGVTPATGRFVWQPGPASLFDTWTPGDHTVTVAWDRTAGSTPDRGEFTWTFRVV